MYTGGLTSALLTARTLYCTALQWSLCRRLPFHFLLLKRKQDSQDRTGQDTLSYKKTPKKLKSVLCGEKCFIVVINIGSHVVPFVQQDNTVYEKERDIISVVSSREIFFFL